MKKLKFKSGFTLVELMVFFIFISLLMAAATPIITKRVKNLPIKIHHGKFVCYGDRYEYYNATKLISSGAGCKFTPPKRATLYKIELVGGGAGGYEYFENPYDNIQTREGGYRLSGGFYGDGYTNLSDGDLWDILKNADFTLYQSSGSGGSGVSVSRNYTGATSPSLSRSKECFQSYYYWDTCTRTVTEKVDTGQKDENGNPIYKEEKHEEEYDCQKYQRDDPNGALETCSDYDARIREAAQTISSWDNCGGGSDSWCHTVVGSTFTTNAYTVADAVPAALGTFSTRTSATGEAASGGSSIGLNLDGKIDFKDYNKDGKLIKSTEIKGYLSKLFTEYYQTGTTSAKGSCAGWGYSKVNDHTGEFDSKNVGLPDSDTYKVGKWGSDIMYYGAIKAWEACSTNCERATGGEGGWFSYYPDSHIEGSYASGVQEGKDASGKCGQVNGPYQVYIGNKPKRIPEVKTTTQLNVRVHVVGNGGGAGAYKVAYVPSLDDDCVFNVAGGGPTINSSVASSTLDSLHASLATSLVCNEGTLRLTAEGGYYDNGTYQKNYNGFDYINPDRTFSNPSSFDTKVDGDTSNFKSGDVYTKYIIGSSSFGAGGSGTAIKDSCTQPYGEYWIKLVYGSTAERTNHDYIKQEPPCDPAANFTTTSASSGSPGVIIISW